MITLCHLMRLWCDWRARRDRVAAQRLTVRATKRQSRASDWSYAATFLKANRR